MTAIVAMALGKKALASGSTEMHHTTTANFLLPDSSSVSQHYSGSRVGMIQGPKNSSLSSSGQNMPGRVSHKSGHLEQDYKIRFNEAVDLSYTHTS